MSNASTRVLISALLIGAAALIKLLEFPEVLKPQEAVVIAIDPIVGVSEIQSLPTMMSQVDAIRQIEAEPDPPEDTSAYPRCSGNDLQRALFLLRNSEVGAGIAGVPPGEREFAAIRARFPDDGDAKRPEFKLVARAKGQPWADVMESDNVLMLLYTLMWDQHALQFRSLSGLLSAPEAVEMLRKGGGVQAGAEGCLGDWMVAVASEGHYEVRTIGETGVWSRIEPFDDPSVAIRTLVQRSNLSEFRPYHD